MSTPTDSLRVAEIASMDKDDKHLENSAIETRNKKKEKLRRVLASSPQPSPQPPSDDESLITVSSKGSQKNKNSPASALLSGLKKIFSPVLKATKCSALDDTDETREERIKRLRKDPELEIQMEVGEVFSLSNSDEILQLEAESEYIPLTLFTTKGREVLSDRLHDVRQ